MKGKSLSRVQSPPAINYLITLESSHTHINHLGIFTHTHTNPRENPTRLRPRALFSLDSPAALMCYKNPSVSCSRSLDLSAAPFRGGNALTAPQVQWEEGSFPPSPKASVVACGQVRKSTHKIVARASFQAASLHHSYKPLCFPQ